LTEENLQRYTEQDGNQVKELQVEQQVPRRAKYTKPRKVKKRSHSISKSKSKKRRKGKGKKQGRSMDVGTLLMEDVGKSIEEDVEEKEADHRQTRIKRAVGNQRAFTKSSTKPIALMSASSVLTRSNQPSYTLEEAPSDKDNDEK